MHTAYSAADDYGKDMEEREMEIQVRKLTKEMADAYLNFFDQDAFSDHVEWSACYCLESHLDREENERLKGKEERRKKAKELIESGVTSGYLVYKGDRVVGWCNAGDKNGYVPVCGNKEYMAEDGADGRTITIYCIDIAPGYRGKGIASLVMEQVLRDAKREGYRYVEGYPLADRELKYQYRGPVRLYEKFGFEMCRTGERICVMRKTI